MGANIPFFMTECFDYYGIEGSQAGVDFAAEQFPMLSKKLICSDFTKNIPFDGLFDLIVDRASITHNDVRSIKNTLQMVHHKLTDRGQFIGIDWFSTKHTDYNTESTTMDAYTRRQIKSGQFAEIGTVHFSDAPHISDLFQSAGYKIDVLEHKQCEQVYPESSPGVATWNLVASKKK